MKKVDDNGQSQQQSKTNSPFQQPPYMQQSQQINKSPIRSQQQNAQQQGNQQSSLFNSFSNPNQASDMLSMMADKINKVNYYYHLIKSYFDYSIIL